MTLASSQGPNLAASSRSRSIAFVLSALIILASIVDNTQVHYLDTDMSWLLIVADKMIAGDRLYVDIWETNPPFSVFLYLPAAWLAQLTGLRAEMLVGLSAYLWTAWCLAFAAWLGQQFDLFHSRHAVWLIPVALALVLLSIPQTFAQREFFGILAALPMLVVAMGRTKPETLVNVGPAIIAGVMASITVMVKPHYVLAFLFPYLYIAARRHSLRILFAPEVFAAAAMTIGYMTVVLVWFPAFISDVLPVVLDTYVARTLDITTIVTNTFARDGFLLLFAYLTLAMFDRGSPHLVMALSAVGFLMAFILLGKGFAYHALPLIVTGGLAVALAALSYFATSRRKAVGIAAIALSLIVLTPIANAHFARNPTAEDIRTKLQGTIHPTIAVIASNITAGHPFTRLVGGRWIGRECSDWIGAYSLERLAMHPEPGLELRLRQYVRDALLRKHDDIVSSQPDIIIVDHRDHAWLAIAMAEPGINHALSNYETIGRQGTIEFFRRKADTAS